MTGAKTQFSASPFLSHFSSKTLPATSKTVPNQSKTVSKTIPDHPNSPPPPPSAADGLHFTLATTLAPTTTTYTDPTLTPNTTYTTYTNYLLNLFNTDGSSSLLQLTTLS